MLRMSKFTAALAAACLLCVATVLPAQAAAAAAAAAPKREFVGAVYAMSNNLTANTLVTYARRRDGTLQLLDPAVQTGGKGAIVNLNMGFDPLFSAFSVVLTADRRFVLAVNAGSASVSVFRVGRDFSLRLVHVQPVAGFGPNSIAIAGRLVYVASVDADGDFDDAFTQRGVLSAYVLLSSGKLKPLRGSERTLAFRPSALKFSPDRRSLLVSDLFSSANALTSGTLNQLVVFRVCRGGLLSAQPVGGVSSTAINNAQGRNLPSAIGFEIIVSRGVQYVVVPEVRGLAGADGGAPANQSASVSTWRLDASSRLQPVQLDVPVGASVTDGQVDACWIQFSPDRRRFWVSNTGSNSLSAFTFEGGRATLAVEVAATGANPVDLWISSDGRFVYQMFTGTLVAYAVGDGGAGVALTEIQRTTDLPPMNSQGVVAF